MSRWVLYQCTQAEVHSSKSARVAVGPFRNGDPSRVHFRFIQSYGGFGQGVVIGIPDGYDRGGQPGEHDGLGEPDRGVLGDLASL